MKILALDKILPGATHEKIGPLMREEARAAWEQYKNGVYRELYFRTDHPGVVLMMECASLDEARAVINSLPLVQAGLVDFDLIPLGPFAPFEMLFAG